MHTFNKSSELILHVFLQGSLWQWGITCDRPDGVGAKVIAYSDPGFCSEQQARADGELARSQRGDRTKGECG
jgi:hypothetical protein